MVGNIRHKGKGRVHFKDEEKRPLVLEGEITVDWDSVFHPPYIKVKTTKKEYLIPFNQIVYIEFSSELNKHGRVD